MDEKPQMVTSANLGDGGSLPAGGKGTRAGFVFILVTVTLDFLAFGIIAPVLPNLVKAFEGGDIARAADVTGYFAFAWALMQFLFSPLLGAWSDRYGRRPVILISCLAAGLDYILMAVAPTLGWLLLGRIISGIATSNVSTAFAYITDTSAPADRAERFGKLGAAFGLGFVIGPAVGGLLGAHSLRAPFWVAAALTLANFLYGAFVLPESLPPEKRAKSAWHMANPLGALALLRTHTVLKRLAMVAALFYTAHQALPSIWVLYTEYRYSWNPEQVGWSLALVGVCAAAVSGGLVGPYVKRFGEKFGLISGLCYGVIGFVGFGLAPRGWAILCAIPFIALWGVAGPSMQSMMSQLVDGSSQGKLQGAINSIRALTGMIGPLVFTRVLAESVSRGKVPGAAYLLAGVLLVMAIGVAGWVVGRKAVVSRESVVGS
jgi:MFS transporter, DHA1 family, tetracycline resistance protein